MSKIYHKVTIVLYEHPAALNDIYTWAAKFGSELEDWREIDHGYITYNHRKEEKIYIAPTSSIKDLYLAHTKLVIYGSVTHDQLADIPLIRTDIYDQVCREIRGMYMILHGIQKNNFGRTAYVNHLKAIDICINGLRPFLGSSRLNDICRKQNSCTFGELMEMVEEARLGLPAE